MTEPKPTPDDTTTKTTPERRVLRSVQDASPTERLLGGLAVGGFVVVWVSSLLSPALLAWVVKSDRRGLGTLLVVLLAMAYSPWQRGTISRAITAFIDHYHLRYYDSYKLVMHHDPFAPAETTTTNNNNNNNNKKKKLLYAIHPHGAFCLGWSSLFHALPGVRFCFSPVLFLSPFFRLFSRLVGNPGTADKPTMVSYMKQGKDLALPPGGFEEATLTSPHHDRVYIKHRMGFVKLCLQHGYAIVPVYCFGENQTYHNLQGFWKFRIGVLNGAGLPAILVWGLPLLPLVPRRALGLHVVAGPPLELPLLPDPTREEVRDWHAKYVAALQELYDGYKDEYYGTQEPAPELEIW